MHACKPCIRAAEGHALDCRAAALEVTDGPGDAYTTVISKAASHRIARGVWTSPGAGDIRRATVACERLVLLLGEAGSLERRDLAALYALQNLPEHSRAELAAYRQSKEAAMVGWWDQKLAGRLWEAVREAPGREPLSMERCLGSLGTLETARPLTW
jgi:hypothetical protein